MSNIRSVTPRRLQFNDVGSITNYIKNVTSINVEDVVDMYVAARYYAAVYDNTNHECKEDCTCTINSNIKWQTQNELLLLTIPRLLYIIKQFLHETDAEEAERMVSYLACS